MRAPLLKSSLFIFAPSHPVCTAERRFARLLCAPVDLSASYVKEHFGVWESVLGFDLTPLVGLAAQRALDGPVITKARALPLREWD